MREETGGVEEDLGDLKPQSGELRIVTIGELERSTGFRLSGTEVVERG